MGLNRTRSSDGLFSKRSKGVTQWRELLFQTKCFTKRKITFNGLGLAETFPDYGSAGRARQPEDRIRTAAERNIEALWKWPGAAWATRSAPVARNECELHARLFIPDEEFLTWDSRESQSVLEGPVSEWNEIKHSQQEWNQERPMFRKP